ncbi:unnamed protein product, partial [Dibothriocephalus latus]
MLSIPLIMIMLYVITAAAMPSPGLDVIRFSRLDERPGMAELDCSSPNAPVFCRYAFARRSSDGAVGSNEQCNYLVTMRSALQAAAAEEEA